MNTKACKEITYLDDDDEDDLEDGDGGGGGNGNGYNNIDDADMGI